MLRTNMVVAAVACGELSATPRDLDDLREVDILATNHDDELRPEAQDLDLEAAILDDDND